MSIRPFQHRSVAHLLARLSLGINIGMHGLSRLGDLQQFAETTAKGFSKTIIPVGLARQAAYPIPFAELVVGVLLIFGLELAWTLVAGMILLMPLIFGINLQQQWDVAGLQLIYVLFYGALLATLEWDRYSIDGVRRRHMARA